MKTLKHGNLHEKLLVLAKSMSFDVFFFHKIPQLLQISAENFTKTLKHGTLFETLLVLAKAMRFDGFSQNPTLFAFFCSKFDENHKIR